MLTTLVVLFFTVVIPVMAEDTLVVYSHRHYPIDKELFQQFERQNGVTVQVLQAGYDELIERIAAEGERTPADVLVTVSAVRLNRAVERGLLVPFVSEVIQQQVPAAFRDSQSYWAALTARARIIVYNTDLVRPRQVRRYHDLTAKRWRGRLAMRTSAHVYNVSLLSALIKNYGRDSATRWVDGIAANLAYAPRGNDRDQIRAVARGDAAATLVNSYYYALLSRDEPDVVKTVAVSFPDQNGAGAHIDVSGIGIVRHSSQRALATKFIEFLTSQAVQERYAAENYEFPVNPQAQPAGLLATWGDVKFDTDNIRQTAQYSATAVSIFDASDWN